MMKNFQITIYVFLKTLDDINSLIYNDLNEVNEIVSESATILFT